MISRNAERDAARAKEQIEILRRQLDVAEIKAKKAAEISSEALADAKGDLMHAREEVKEWARKARAAVVEPPRRGKGEQGARPSGSCRG